MALREMIFDTETTGLDPYNGHRLLEIGVVELVDRVPSGRTFQSYLNPERDIPPEASRVHGITAQKVEKAPLFSAIAQSLLDFLGDGVLVAHNAEFDLRFLNWELKLANREAWPQARVIDTVAMVRKLFPGAKASLDAVAMRFNIDLSARTFHGALLDAQILSQVYIELTGGRQRALGLNSESLCETTFERHQFPLQSPSPTPRAARIFNLKDEEKIEHIQFIKQMPSTLWQPNHTFEETNNSSFNLYD
jgi:DNA polymerase-3 subunit epsilon